MNQINMYRTASNVAVFLNGVHVDQAYAFEFKENIPKIPIYGYNDYKYSKVVRGKGIVQGILVLNFVHPAYLNSVISNAKVGNFIPNLYNYNLIPMDDKAAAEKIVNDSKLELPPNIDQQSKIARAEAIASLLSKKNEKIKDKIKTKLVKEFTAYSEPENQTTVGRSLGLDIVTQSPMILDVYYTDPNQSLYFTRFNHVEFTESSQSMSQAGAEGSSEPLYMIHQFIARDIDVREIRN